MSSPVTSKSTESFTIDSMLDAVERMEALGPPPHRYTHALRYPPRGHRRYEKPVPDNICGIPVRYNAGVPKDEVWLLHYQPLRLAIGMKMPEGPFITRIIFTPDTTAAEAWENEGGR